MDLGEGEARVQARPGGSAVPRPRGAAGPDEGRPKAAAPARPAAGGGGRRAASTWRERAAARWAALDGRGGLPRPDPWLAGLVAVAAAPVVVAVVAAISRGWIPVGDDGVLAFRAGGVLRGRIPLVGMPTAADSVSGSLRSNHPGPLETWALAVPYRVLGPAGMLLVVGAVNVAAIAAVVSAAFRQAGRGLAVVAATLVLVLSWTLGPTIVRDPLHTHAALFPFLAMLFLAWEVRLGRWRSLIGATLAACWVTQAHVAYVPLAIVVALGVGVLVGVDPLPANRRKRPARRRAIAWSLGLAAVLCLPVMIDQATGTGNLTRLRRVATADGLGVGGGVRITVRAFGIVPAFLRSGSGPLLLLERPTLADSALALITLGLLGWLLVDRRRHHDHPARTLLEVAALTMFGLAVAGAFVPEGGAVIAADAMFLLWPVTGVTWLALVWAGWRQWAEGRSVRALRPVEAQVLTAVGLVVATVVVVSAAGSTPRFGGFADDLVDPMAAVAPAVRAATADDDTVQVHADGWAATAYARSGTMALLDREGIRATTEDQDADALRIGTGGPDPSGDLWLVSGATGRVQPAPGARLVARVDLVPGGTRSELAQRRRRLQAAISRAGEVRLHDGPYVTTAEVSREYFRFRDLPDSGDLTLPADWVRPETFTELWAAGMVESPKLDADLVRQVRADDLGRWHAPGDLVLSVWYRPTP